MSQDIGTYAPFPEGGPRALPHVDELAVRVGGKYHATRPGLELLAAALGYAVEYDGRKSDANQARVHCTLRRGQTVLGCTHAEFPLGVRDAVRAAQAQALVAALQQHAPEVLATAQSIIQEATP